MSCLKSSVETLKSCNDIWHDHPLPLRSTTSFISQTIKNLHCFCVCVCVCLCAREISFLRWCSMTVLPSLPGSIFTVHPLLQNHSVTAPQRLSLPPPPTPPVSVLLVTFTVCLDGRAWSWPITASYECARSPCGSNTLLATLFRQSMCAFSLLFCLLFLC